MSVNEPEGSNSERRAHPRYAFGLVQGIAQLSDDKLPPRDSFEKVRCVDISRGGFSFYRTTLPEFDSLVVALGDPPDFTYLAARIVNSVRVKRWGYDFFRIGCQFTGQVWLHGSTVFEQKDDLEAAFAPFVASDEEVVAQHRA